MSGARLSLSLSLLASQALDSLIHKSGCVDPISPELRASLSVTRFISTKCTLPFTSYVEAMSTGPQAALYANASTSPTPRLDQWPTPREGAQATPRVLQ